MTRVTLLVLFVASLQGAIVSHEIRRIDRRLDACQAAAPPASSAPASAAPAVETPDARLARLEREIAETRRIVADSTYRITRGSPVAENPARAPR